MIEVSNKKQKQVKPNTEFFRLRKFYKCVHVQPNTDTGGIYVLRCFACMCLQMSNLCPTSKPFPIYRTKLNVVYNPKQNPIPTRSKSNSNIYQQKNKIEMSVWNTHCFIIIIIIIIIVHIRNAKCVVWQKAKNNIQSNSKILEKRLTCSSYTTVQYWEPMFRQKSLPRFTNQTIHRNIRLNVAPQYIDVQWIRYDTKIILRAAVHCWFRAYLTLYCNIHQYTLKCVRIHNGPNVIVNIHTFAHLTEKKKKEKITHTIIKERVKCVMWPNRMIWK